MKRLGLVVALVVVLGGLASAAGTYGGFVNPTILVDGVAFVADVPPTIFNGHTVAPVRALAERLSYTAGWDGENQLVALDNPPAPLSDPKVAELELRIAQLEKKGIGDTVAWSFLLSGGFATVVTLWWTWWRQNLAEKKVAQREQERVRGILELLGHELAMAWFDLSVFTTPGGEDAFPLKISFWEQVRAELPGMVEPELLSRLGSVYYDIENIRFSVRNYAKPPREAMIQMSLDKVAAGIRNSIRSLLPMLGQQQPWVVDEGLLQKLREEWDPAKVEKLLRAWEALGLSSGRSQPDKKPA